MKRYILLAAAVVFCFIGCETVQEAPSPTDPPVFEETEIPEPVEIPTELNDREAELDRLEQELNAELANLRLREQQLEVSRLFRPQGTVVVENGNALRFRYEASAIGRRYGRHELDDRVAGGAG